MMDEWDGICTKCFRQWRLQQKPAGANPLPTYGDRFYMNCPAVECGSYGKVEMVRTDLAWQYRAATKEQAR